MTTGSDSPTHALAEAMSEKASRLLDALSEEQRAKASLPFEDDAERTRWAYFPWNSAGLPLFELDPRQQKLVHKLLASALSTSAYTQAALAMASESLVDLLEDWRLEGARDPRRYFLSVFGTPGAAAWGWRFEGHHVVLNFTIAGGEVVSATPLFIGAQPAEVQNANSTILRVCAAEEDTARELLASLDSRQRSAAVLADEAPPDFVLTNQPSVPDAMTPGENAPQFLSGMFAAMSEDQKAALRFSRETPLGVPGATLSDGQQALLSALIDVYLGRLPEPLARAERAKIDDAGLDGVHFAWAGGTRPGEPHYYRVHGQRFLVEYDNTQNNVDHAHSVWRDMDADFGGDALRAHLRAAH